MSLIRITAIPQLYRNINRWAEILSILSKYGLAEWLSRFDLFFARELLASRRASHIAALPFEERIRLALSELGPTTIKLGQILSTRSDLVGVELAAELETLQSNAPATPFDQISETIIAELGGPIEDFFDDFEEEPFGSASIGQVHRACLKTGEKVVVKVQHPGIARKMRIDLDILVGMAQLAERVPELQIYRPQASAEEFQRVLLKELDFGSEARNMAEFSRNFKEDPSVKIPCCYHALSTGKVLTMEYIDGIPLAGKQKLIDAGCDLDLLARRGAKLYMDMIFEFGVYHADPHPGNIIILEDSVIGLIDFGMVGRLDEQLHEQFEEIMMAIGDQDSIQILNLITRITETPGTIDVDRLRADISEFLAHYTGVNVEKLDLGSALNDFITMVRRHHILLPSPISLLLKVLIMLDGTAKRLSPQFSLAEVMLPYQRQMIWHRFSPHRQLKRFRRFRSEVGYLVEILPRGLVDIVKRMQTGTFDIHLIHKGLEPSVNRLVFGMLTSAMFLGSSVMLSFKVPPVVQGLSVLGFIGGVVSIVLGIRLIRAINKSGHLE